MFRRGYVWLVIVAGLVVLLFAPATIAQDEAASYQVLPPQYRKWLDEDARYIIADQERSEFAKLTNDQQRDEFVERFWEKRNPEPGSSPNVYKEQHYERIRFAISHFSVLDTSGWKTDRGRIYIVFGPPDHIDQHFSAAGSHKASDLFGVAAIPYDWELWRYGYIEGIGEDVDFTFVDTCGCGRYEMPREKRDLNRYKTN